MSYGQGDEIRDLKAEIARLREAYQAVWDNHAEDNAELARLREELEDAEMRERGLIGSNNIISAERDRLREDRQALLDQDRTNELTRALENIAHHPISESYDNDGDLKRHWEWEAKSMRGIAEGALRG